MRAILPLAVVLALALPVHAEACVPTTSVTNDRMIVVELPRNGLMDYLVDDLCQKVETDPNGTISVWFGHEFARVPSPVQPAGCVFSIWQYIEANDMPGLQRGDEMHDDTCGGLIESDSIWF